MQWEPGLVSKWGYFFERLVTLLVTGSAHGTSQCQLSGHTARAGLVGVGE
jgi:hypothetical protein